MDLKANASCWSAGGAWAPRPWQWYCATWRRRNLENLQQNNSWRSMPTHFWRIGLRETFDNSCTGPLFGVRTAVASTPWPTEFTDQVQGVAATMNCLFGTVAGIFLEGAMPCDTWPKVAVEIHLADRCCKGIQRHDPSPPKTCDGLMASRLE